MRTRDARYMLILWTKEGESELKITLCNQSGTLKISRDSMPFPSTRKSYGIRGDVDRDKVTPEDIRPFLGMNEASNVPAAVDIEFPEMETTIHFLHIGGKPCIVFEPNVRATAAPPPKKKGKAEVRFRNS